MRNRNILIKILICLCLVGVFSSCKTKQKKSDHIKIETVEIGINTTNKKIVRLIKEANNWMGTPYKYGGAEKLVGTDCSGMIMVLFDEICDIKLPRNSAMQAEFCNNIEKNKVKSGDLVFFATGNDPKKISHVGLMLDNVRFIHASSTKGVTISEITTPYYMRTFIMFGRVPGLHND